MEEQKEKGSIPFDISDGSGEGGPAEKKPREGPASATSAVAGEQLAESSRTNEQAEEADAERSRERSRSETP